jgi:hypothetical protein
MLLQALLRLYENDMIMFPTLRITARTMLEQRSVPVVIFPITVLLALWFEGLVETSIFKW